MAKTQIIYEGDVEGNILCELFYIKNFDALHTWVSLNCEVLNSTSDTKTYKLTCENLYNLKENISEFIIENLSHMAGILNIWYNRDSSEDTECAIMLDEQTEIMSTEKYSEFKVHILEDLSDKFCLYKIFRLYDFLTGYLYTDNKEFKNLYYEISI